MGMTKPLLLPKINYLPALWNALLQTMHIRKQNFLVEVKWVKKSPFQKKKKSPFLIPSIEEPTCKSLGGLQAT